MKEKIAEIRAAFDMLVQQRSSAAVDGHEGDNSTVEKGEVALSQLEELYK